MSNAKGILDSLGFQPDCSYRHVFGNHHDSSIRGLGPSKCDILHVLCPWSACRV